MRSKLFLLLNFSILSIAYNQEDFPYNVDIQEVNIPNFPGIHSFAFGQINDEWLLFGGRRDGLHARQPFASFPEDQANKDIIFVNINQLTSSTKSIESLPVNLQEHLSATNMNFYQNGQHLIIIGGYGFSTSKNTYLTYPYMTIIDLVGLLNAIRNNHNIAPFFKQVEDIRFSVTGGQLGKINNIYYLIGGHDFEGRYNPMGGPSFTQSYTNQIRKFYIDYSEPTIEWEELPAVTDPIHLHRRDYNLIPMIYENSEPGYLISSGVFQLTADLPFLYPVEIYADKFIPRTEFNQYLSNYHGAKVALFDEDSETMHSLFFGGLSQYYFKNDSLIKDDLVPFVSSISRVSRDKFGVYKEYNLDKSLPDWTATSGEFINNHEIPQSIHKVVYLSELEKDTIFLGHIVGGIKSPERNPFNNNRTHVTSADNRIWRINLVKESPSSSPPISGYHHLKFDLNPNPVNNQLHITYDLPKNSRVEYLITDSLGRIIKAGDLLGNEGENSRIIPFDNDSLGPYLFTLIIDHRYYLTKKFIRY